MIICVSLFASNAWRTDENAQEEMICISEIRQRATQIITTDEWYDNLCRLIICIVWYEKAAQMTNTLSTSDFWACYTQMIYTQIVFSNDTLIWIPILTLKLAISHSLSHAIVNPHLRRHSLTLARDYRLFSGERTSRRQITLKHSLSVFATQSYSLSRFSLVTLIVTHRLRTSTTTFTSISSVTPTNDLLFPASLQFLSPTTSSNHVAQHPRTARRPLWSLRLPEHSSCRRTLFLRQWNFLFFFSIFSTPN